MSRTKKGTKPPGWEPWGKRPGTAKAACLPQKDQKKYTHRKERIEGKKIIKKESDK